MTRNKEGDREFLDFIIGEYSVSREELAALVSMPDLSVPQAKRLVREVARAESARRTSMRATATKKHNHSLAGQHASSGGSGRIRSDA